MVSFTTIFISALAIILVFSLVVLVHELGHFTAAKFFKVRVEEFGMGLPPKAITLWKKGDTSYTLNWIPFGGFVRMYGESDLEGDLATDPDSFSSKPVWQRMIIASAGVFMNFVLAFMLLVGLFFFGYTKPLYLVPDNKYPLNGNSYIIMSEQFALEKKLIIPQTLPEYPVSIVNVHEGSLAKSIGIKDGSTLRMLSGKKITTREDFKNIYQSLPQNVEHRLEIAEGEEIKTVSFKKTADTFGIELGIYPAFKTNAYPLKFSFSEAIISAAYEVRIQSSYMFQAIGQIFGKLFSKLSVPEEMGGPVMIAKTISDASQAGFDSLLLLAVLISINLGVFNIIPFPALDGGRIVFMLYEIIARRRPNEKVENTIHLTGYAFLMILILLVTYQDIVRLL